MEYYISNILTPLAWNIPLQVQCVLSIMVSGHHDHMPLISDNCYNYKKHMSTTPFYIRHTRPTFSKIGAKVDFVIVDLFVYLLSGSVGWYTCGIDCLKYETLYIYLTNIYIQALTHRFCLGDIQLNLDFTFYHSVVMQFCTQHKNKIDETSGRLWIYKRLPLSHLHGWDMWCLWHIMSTLYFCHGW